jgi:ABC-type sugar transport system substrate-binding protein
MNADTSSPMIEGFTSQITLARDQGAYAAAKTMAEAVPNAKVGLITIGAPVPAFAFQVERLQFWGEKEGLSTLGVEANTADGPEGGAQAMNSLIAKHSDMNGAIAYNDLTGLSAMGAVRASGRDVKMISFNGESTAQEAVESGQLLGTYMIDWVGVGSQAVLAAYSALTDQNQPLPKLIVRKGRMVTKDNAASVPTLEEQLQELSG